MKTFTSTLAAALATALLAGPVLADDLTVSGRRLDRDSITIPYGDLQLTLASQQQALRDRVNRAVRRGCRNLYGASSTNQRWQCEDIAKDIAEPQVAAAIAGADTATELAARTIRLRFASS